MDVGYIKTGIYAGLLLSLFGCASSMEEQSGEQALSSAQGLSQAEIDSLRAGCDKAKGILSEEYHCQLNSKNLSGEDLRGADLGHATMHKTNLINADLRGADLSHAYLGGAILKEANLGGAKLYFVNVSAACGPCLGSSKCSWLPPCPDNWPDN